MLETLLGAGTGSDEDASDFNLDRSAIELPGNQQQTSWPESVSWFIAALLGETPAAVKEFWLHSCSMVKFPLVVDTHPDELKWFISVHRPAAMVLRLSSLCKLALETFNETMAVSAFSLMSLWYSGDGDVAEISGFSRGEKVQNSPVADHPR